MREGYLFIANAVAFLKEKMTGLAGGLIVYSERLVYFSAGRFEKLRRTLIRKRCYSYKAKPHFLENKADSGYIRAESNSGAVLANVLYRI